MNNASLLRSALVLATGCMVSIALAAGEDPGIARGRYMTQTGGCNDCHTPMYRERDGNVPVSEWLTGAPVGFKGAWGTTYPANLRLIAQTMNEDAWLTYARQPRRPPMPWFNVRDMSDDDVRAMYRFIRSLGAKGSPAPAYAPPGASVATPWISFELQNLPPPPAKPR